MQRASASFALLQGYTLALGSGQVAHSGCSDRVPRARAEAKQQFGMGSALIHQAAKMDMNLPYIGMHIGIIGE